MSHLAPQLAEHAERLVRTAQSQFQTTLDTTLKGFDLQPKAALYAALLCITFVWVTYAATQRIRNRKGNSAEPGTPNLEKRAPFKAPGRPFGVWPPSPFTRPPASPHPTFSLTTTAPRPYRPFRHGPKYNITMGLRTMHWDEWIELDNEFLSYHSLKSQRLEQRGEKVVRTAKEAEPAAQELLEELMAYLPERYPSLFQSTRNERGQEKGKEVRNVVTGEVFTVDMDGCERNGVKEDAMSLCARMVQDDLAIMVEGGDGMYYFLAGAILLAGFWRLQDKFGMGLSEIHTGGDVPGFKQKLEKGMTNFFRRIRPENPVVRNNYFIQVDDKLAWSESIGDEDAEGIGWFTAEKNKAIEHHWFRSERQSLRRLPKSGGVVFTIRTYFHPITSLAQEPHVPGRLASAIRSWGDDVSRYKGKERYGEVLLEYLDGEHRKQVEAGLDVEGEEEGRGYPF